MVGTTLDVLVDRARRDSLLASRGPFNLLDGAIDNNPLTTTLTLADDFSHIGRGEIIAVDYELMYVRNTITTTRQVEVIRGFLNSTIGNHADSALVEVAPRFPKAQFLDSAYHEMLSWRGKLFKATTVDVAITQATTNYPLTITGSVDFLLDIRLEPTATGAVATNWWTWSWTGDRWASAQARIIRRLDGSNDDVRLQLKHLPQASTTAKVTVAQPIAPNGATLAGTTDLVTDLGLDPAWFDLLEVGVKWRALSTGVIGRADWRSANTARAAEEVSPLDVVRAAGHLRDLRAEKLGDAMMQLRGDWPYRERW
jgi:hypothetical protein